MVHVVAAKSRVGVRLKLFLGNDADDEQICHDDDEDGNQDCRDDEVDKTFRLACADKGYDGLAFNLLEVLAVDGDANCHFFSVVVVWMARDARRHAHDVGIVDEHTHTVSEVLKVTKDWFNCVVRTAWYR